MRSVLRIASLFSLGAMFIVANVGCEPAAAPKPDASNAGAKDHDHDHGTLAVGNFAESLGTLTKFYGQIKTAFEADKPDDAHDALHDIGHVLEALELQTADLPAEKQEAAKQAVKDLFEGYTLLDEGMHGKKETKYSEVSSKLEAAVKTLESSKP